MPRFSPKAVFDFRVFSANWISLSIVPKNETHKASNDTLQKSQLEMTDALPWCTILRRRLNVVDEPGGDPSPDLKSAQHASIA